MEGVELTIPSSLVRWERGGRDGLVSLPVVRLTGSIPV